MRSTPVNQLAQVSLYQKNLEKVSADEALPKDALEFKILSNEIQAMLVQYIAEIGKKPDIPLTSPSEQSPEVLSETLKEMLELPSEASPHRFLEVLQKTLQHSVKTWSPRFMDKLFAGTTPVGALSDLVISVLNSNAHVYHVSPVFTLVEIKALETLASKFGFPEGRGVFCPGGSYSNLHAMITARNALCPDIVDDGISSSDKPICIFTSEHCHYSIEKSAITLGVGKRYTYKVPTDKRGRMIPSQLEKMMMEAKVRGERPFFVCATAGTTVLGAFDPIRKIANICQKFGCWLHVDGSWGGSVVFHEKYRALLDGVELADSVTINPHKLLGVPLLCSALVMKDPTIMQRVNSLNSGYLFHGDNYDLGDATIGCGRRPDAFKFFMSWVYYGEQGFHARVDKAIKCSQYLASRLKAKTWKGSFELMMDPEFANICFWYYPPSENLMNISMKSGIREYLHGEGQERLSEITRQVHAQLQKEGSFMVDYSPLKLNGELVPLFWRAVFNHPEMSFSMIDKLLNRIDEIGSSMTF